MRAASYCDVTLIYYLTLYLWTLSSSQWRCQQWRFSMAAHRHDRRGIYRCVLLRFRGRIKIDHSCGLRCRGLCCHSRHSTRGAAGAAASGRATAGPTRAVPGVAAQTTKAQTVSWSIPITIFGSDNGLSSSVRQAIFWTSHGILIIEPQEQTSVKFESQVLHFHSWKCIWKWR